MTVARYPIYENSGVEWLGDIPIHWSPVRLSVLFGEVVDTGAVDLPILSVSIHHGVSDRELDPDEMDRKVTRSDDRTKYKRVMPGDLVYNMMRAWQGGFGTVQTPGLVSPAYVVARPKQQIRTAFIEHLLRTPAAVEEMRRHSRGVTDFRLRLYWDEFKSIKVALPPLFEQAAIIAFLERETAKIDALVEEQKRLIDLLLEERRAKILQVATKGLNPDTGLRDSGIDWLGSVPEHWQIQTLNRITLSKCDGPFGSGLKSEHYTEDGVRVVRLQNIGERIFETSDAAYISNDYYIKDLGGGHDVWPGDVLIAGLGDDNNSVGRACVAPSNLGPTMVKADCFRFRLDRAKAIPEFIAMQLNVSARYDAGKLSSGSTRSRIPLSVTARRWIACPSAREQVEIVAAANKIWEEADALIQAAEYAVALLRERRSALIAAAVTGKIDVREIANSPSVHPGDRDTIRAAVASAIIMRFSHRHNFGRVKLQKFLYLAETYADVAEMAGSYDREAAGPLDRVMLSEVEAGLQRAGAVSIEQLNGRGGQVIYKALRLENQDASSLPTMLGERKRKFNHLLNELGDLDTKPVEAVTTLFAVWNDFLIDGQTPTHDAIVSGVLNDWHPEKRDKFTADELTTWLGWMRRRDIVPHGQGPRTSTGRLFL